MFVLVPSGPVAQLGARMNGIHEVTGSTPVWSTNSAQAQGMAHLSYPSPDRRWVLLMEMDEHHAWTPCRVVPVDGSGPGRRVGPPGAACTFGAWSPDGE